MVRDEVKDYLRGPWAARGERIVSSEYQHNTRCVGIPAILLADNVTQAIVQRVEVSAVVVREAQCPRDVPMKIRLGRRGRRVQNCDPRANFKGTWSCSHTRTCCTPTWRRSVVATTRPSWACSRTPIDVFLSEGDTTRAVAYFQYDWTVRDGSLITFKVMDLFSFAPDSDKVTYLDLIYDTHPIREPHGNKYEPPLTGG